MVCDLHRLTLDLRQGKLSIRKDAESFRPTFAAAQPVGHVSGARHAVASLALTSVRLCPSDTPEGESCGLVKNLALMTHVTTDSDVSIRVVLVVVVIIFR